MASNFDIPSQQQTPTATTSFSLPSYSSPRPPPACSTVNPRPGLKCSDHCSSRLHDPLTSAPPPPSMYPPCENHTIAPHKIQQPAMFQPSERQQSSRNPVQPHLGSPFGHVPKRFGASMSADNYRPTPVPCFHHPHPYLQDQPRQPQYQPTLQFTPTTIIPGAGGKSTGAEKLGNAQEVTQSVNNNSNSTWPYGANQNGVMAATSGGYPRTWASRRVRTPTSGVLFPVFLGAGIILIGGVTVTLLLVMKAREQAMSRTTPTTGPEPMIMTATPGMTTTTTIAVTMYSSLSTTLSMTATTTATSLMTATTTMFVFTEGSASAATPTSAGTDTSKAALETKSFSTSNQSSSTGQGAAPLVIVVNNNGNSGGGGADYSPAGGSQTVNMLTSSQSSSLKTLTLTEVQTAVDITTAVVVATAAPIVRYQ